MTKVNKRHSFVIRRSSQGEFRGDVLRGVGFRSAVTGTL